MAEINQKIDEIMEKIENLENFTLPESSEEYVNLMNNIYKERNMLLKQASDLIETGEFYKRLKRMRKHSII